MSAVTNLLNEAGQSLVTLLANDNVVYLFYFIVFLFGLFTLYRRLLNKVSHLSGKPASVLSFMISVISVGGIFYGRSANELISLFNGFAGLLLALILTIAVIGGAIYWGKSREKKVTQVLFISTGVYIGLSFFTPIYLDVFNLNENALGEGATSLIASLLLFINATSLIVGLISLVLFIGGLLDFRSNDYSNKSERSQEIGKINDILKEINESFGNANKHFKNKAKLLNDMSKPQASESMKTTDAMAEVGGAH